MQAIEFETYQNKGMIPIPDKYKNSFNGKLKVIILSSDNRQDFKLFNEIPQSMKNPYKSDCFNKYSRNELNAR
ncbi:MAG TPA: hypothetical protein PK385_02190 [Spirochaetota bacterium]|nr:hypothetical protein [Spirochaetota bacterium]HOS33691.1 hypothetical protein [Spirochaetota bacterium]HOS54847.1 hypothetical protein [Spirochaetota bacterium]HPK61953.1 hypothetical protein [Spirochaetota bacterium]HQF76802.1 hypothetical protein [Spirochaetota bacterium]